MAGSAKVTAFPLEVSRSRGSNCDFCRMTFFYGLVYVQVGNQETMGDIVGSQ